MNRSVDQCLLDRAGPSLYIAFVTNIFMRSYRRLPYHDPSQLALSCPLCDHGYEPYQARILRNKEESQLWYVLCSNCLHGIMLLVTQTDYGINSVGVITDMSDEDVMRLQDQSAVSTDDCITLHQAIDASPELFLGS